MTTAAPLTNRHARVRVRVCVTRRARYAAWRALPDATESTAINAGFLTVALVDSAAGGRPIRLPPSLPRADDGAAAAEHAAALARRELRVQRRQMFSLNTGAMRFTATLCAATHAPTHMHIWTYHMHTCMYICPRNHIPTWHTTEAMLG